MFMIKHRYKLLGKGKRTAIGSRGRRMIKGTEPGRTESKTTIRTQSEISRLSTFNEIPLSRN